MILFDLRGASLFAMFLYWKKRGAYELETLPSSIRGAERYSWSSSLDVIHDLYGKAKLHSS